MIILRSSLWTWFRLQLLKMACTPPKKPVVFVIGSTGTGKSDLAVRLATRFNGEIINADAMQMYRGLPVVTNKMDEADRAGVPHHIFDTVDPLQLDYRIPEFRRDARRAIDEIHSRNHLPIVAGGSLYYIESLLWEMLISLPDDASTNAAPSLLPLSSDSHTSATIALTSEALQGITSPELYKTLKLIDPEQAAILHPNDKRKIIRSLEIYFQHGKRHSTLLWERQRNKPGGTSISGPLMQREAIVILLRCSDENELNRRLDTRVENMIQRNLIGELREFHKKYDQQRSTDASSRWSYEQSIFQSIGFKEFHNFLLATRNSENFFTDVGGNNEELQNLWDSAVEQMKRRTRKYARSQIQWINNRFLHRSDRELPSTYCLDVSDKSKWHANVLPRAEQLVAEFLLGASLDAADRVMQTAPALNVLDQQNYICDICDRTLRGKRQYEVHVQSKSHRNMRRKAGRIRRNLLSAGEDSVEMLESNISNEWTLNTDDTSNQVSDARQVKTGANL